MANETKPASETEILRQQLAAMQQTLDLLMQQRQAITPDTLWAREEMKQQARDAAQEAVAQYINVPSPLRSQYEANKTFESGKKIFQVLLGTGKKGECPVLFIKADVESDAKSRYQVVCGINHIVPDAAHPEFSRWTIADVTDSKEAQDAVKASWKYQPQAA